MIEALDELTGCNQQIEKVLAAYQKNRFNMDFLHKIIDKLESTPLIATKMKSKRFVQSQSVPIHFYVDKRLGDLKNILRPQEKARNRSLLHDNLHKELTNFYDADIAVDDDYIFRLAYIVIAHKQCIDKSPGYF